MKLYDGWDWEPGCHRGLMPGNELAIQIYQFWHEDQRIGTFDCAPLMRTATIGAVSAILDEFDEYLPTWLHRQNMLKKLLIIDSAATNARNKKEESARAAQRAAAEAANKK